MQPLKEGIQDSLARRRGLGFKLKKHSRFLIEFASFLEQVGMTRRNTGKHYAATRE
jgi:hypothetical protein